MTTGIPSGSTAIVVPRSVSSRSTTSGRKSSSTPGTAPAIRRAPRSAKLSANSCSVARASVAVRGARSRPAGVPEWCGAGLVAYARNPSASILATSPPEPATATSCPAARAARASGRSGVRWPWPPTKVQRIRMVGPDYGRRRRPALSVRQATLGSCELGSAWRRWPDRWRRSRAGSTTAARWRATACPGSRPTRTPTRGSCSSATPRRASRPSSSSAAWPTATATSASCSSRPTPASAPT